MASLPIGLIKGQKNVRKERLNVQDKQTETRERIQAIRNKVASFYLEVNPWLLTAIVRYSA